MQESDDLESRFETDLGETADATFEPSRASARVVISALEEYEPFVEGSDSRRSKERSSTPSDSRTGARPGGRGPLPLRTTGERAPFDPSATRASPVG